MDFKLKGCFIKETDWLMIKAEASAKLKSGQLTISKARIKSEKNDLEIYLEKADLKSRKNKKRRLN